MATTKTTQPRWFLEYEPLTHRIVCSDCGLVAVATDDAHADSVMVNHTASHGVAVERAL